MVYFLSHVERYCQRSWRERVALRFLSPSKLNAFAKIVGQRITTRCPPVIANNPEQIVSQKRIAEILEEIFSSAPQFRGENRLGILGRAKLRHAFKWELLEIGYEGKFVDFATEKLIAQLTRRTE
jgi:hypothetical protein